nr:hypothetical protein HmN_000949000 [Hymenolepis microstoma]
MMDHSLFEPRGFVGRPRIYRVVTSLVVHITTSATMTGQLDGKHVNKLVIHIEHRQRLLKLITTNSPEPIASRVKDPFSIVRQRRLKQQKPKRREQRDRKLIIKPRLITNCQKGGQNLADKLGLRKPLSVI